MSFGSFGAGLAGFANGLNNGLTVGERLGDMIQRDKLARVREQGIAEAQAMQAKAMPQVVDNGDMQNLTANPQQNIDPNADQSAGANGQRALAAFQTSAPRPSADQITLGAEPQASRSPMAADVEASSPAPFAQGLPKAKRFQVGSQAFDTKADADAYAKSQAPAIEEFYATTLVPRMKEALMAQGKPDQAAAWQKYADDDKTRKHMKTWGEAFQFAQLGDYNQAAQRLIKLHPDFDDGYEVVSAKPTKGPDGADGFTMKIRDEDGNEQEIFHDAQTITELGLSQLSPIEMFNKRFQRQTQADTLKARAAIDATNDARTTQSRLQVEEKRQAGQGERQEVKIAADEKKLATQEAGRDRRVERQGQLAAERDANRIKASGMYRKDASPEEQRRIVWQTLSRDPLFTTATPEEQEERVGQAIQFIQGGKGAAPAATGTSTTANPFSGAAETGVPVFRNGRIERVQR